MLISFNEISSISHYEIVINLRAIAGLISGQGRADSAGNETSQRGGRFVSKVCASSWRGRPKNSRGISGAYINWLVKNEQKRESRIIYNVVFDRPNRMNGKKSWSSYRRGGNAKEASKGDRNNSNKKRKILRRIWHCAEIKKKKASRER